jgi:hypothetical protein
MQILMPCSKIDIKSSVDPNEMVQILLGFFKTLFFNKNIKLGMFYRKINGYYLCLLFMYEKKKIISLCRPLQIM